MKFLVFWGILLWLPISFARWIVIRSSDSNAIEYQSYLKENINRVSFVQSYFDNEFKPPKDGYGGVTTPDEVSRTIERMSTEPLTSQHREILISLYLKIQTLNVPQQTLFRYENRINSLVMLDPALADLFGIKIDQSKKVHPGQIKEFLSQIRYEHELYIDGILFNDNLNIQNSEHQWILVSNIYEPLIFNGLWADFVQKISGLRPFVNFRCDPSSKDELHNWSTWDEAFFSSKCVYKKPQPFHHQPEIQAQSRWLWPTVGILALGAALALKDKVIVFKSPF